MSRIPKKGIVRWTYQKRPVEIPILDPDKV